MVSIEQNVAQLVPLHAKVHQRSQKITVRQRIRKFFIQRADAHDCDRKHRRIAVLRIGRQKQRGFPLCRLISAGQHVTHARDFIYRAVEQILLRQRQKLRMRRNIPVITLLCQILDPSDQHFFLIHGNPPLIHRGLPLFSFGQPTYHTLFIKQH